MTHAWCCLLRFGVHDPRNTWHLLASAKQWKFTFGSSRGPLESLFFLSYVVASPSGSGRFFSRPRSLPICFFVLSPCPKLCVVQLRERKGKLCLKQAGGRHMHCCQQHMHIDSCFVCWREKLSYFSSVQEGMLLCFCNLRKPRDSLSCSVPLEQGYALAHGTT